MSEMSAKSAENIQIFLAINVVESIIALTIRIDRRTIMFREKLEKALVL